MIYYHRAIQYNDLTLSIDSIILDVSITKSEMRDLLNSIIVEISNSNKLSTVTWESYKPGTFRHQTLFQIDDNRSFWLGHGLIGSGTLIDRYRLDFNPNKVGDDPNLRLLLEFLVRNSRNNFCKISRFDLAIDIPVERSKCFLVKDHRLYIERKHGVEYTQYLGSKSSTVGRVKLYNKQAEAKLSSPLTRLELTLDPSTPFEQISFPSVYYIDKNPSVATNRRITDTDRFIINAILNGAGKLSDLGRKTRAKIEGIIQEETSRVQITEDAYSAILTQLGNYLAPVSTDNYQKSKAKETNYE